MKVRSFTRGLIASKGLMKIFSMGLLGMFFLYLLVSASISAYQQKDAGVFFKDIGEQISKPLQKAQESSLEVIQSEDIGLMKKIWKYWGFFVNIYKVYLWFWVCLFIINLFTKDAIPVMARYPLAIILFLLILITYNSVILKENINYTFIVFGDIFRAIVSLF